MSHSSHNDEEVFCNRMTEVVSSGHTLAGLSLGVKLGLFKSLAEEEGSITPQQLADKTQCKERYVREWLYHMVVCDVIDVDVTGKMFSLPSYRHKALTEDGNLVTERSSIFSYMLLPHDDILKCFRNDGPLGLPFENVIGVVKETTEFGMKSLTNMYMKELSQSFVESKLESGAKFLDVGCGKGDLLLNLATKFPNSKFVGIDMSSDLLAVAKASQQLSNITNLEYFDMDALCIPASWHNTFDVICSCIVVHDLSEPVKVLEAIYECLKQDGRLFIFEFNTSSNIHKTNQDPAMKRFARLMYAISMYHCVPSSMYFPNSVALGTIPGVECLVDIITKAKFKLSCDPKPCGKSNICLVFEK